MIRRGFRAAPVLSGLVILTTALVMRLQYILVAQVDNPLRADAGQYFRIAINVVTYGIFSVANPAAGVPLPDTYRAPAYPAFLATLLAASGDLELSYWFALVAQAIMGAIAALLMFLLARRRLNAGYAFVTGLLVAIWPHLVTQGGYILTESLFGSLIVVAVFVSVRAVESGRSSTYVAAGFTFATAALINQMLVLFPLLMLPLVHRVGQRSKVMLFVLAAFLPPALWAVRDATIHSPAAVSAGERVFENILIGMEPDFNRYYRNQEDALGVAARQRVRSGLDEYVKDRRLAYVRVLTRLEEDPLHYLAWFAQKPFLLWAWSIGQGAGDIYVYPMITSPFETNMVYRIVAAVCHGLNMAVAIGAFLAAIVVLAKWRRRLATPDVPLLLCALVFCYATAIYAVLTPDARYANPFRPFEIALALAFAAWLHDRLRLLRSRRANLSNKTMTVDTSSSIADQLAWQARSPQRLSGSNNLGRA